MPAPIVTPPKRAGRVDRRVQEFRARVLETAEELFSQDGVEATKIDDICEAADVAKRTLCNHFPTKAHIVQALSMEAVSRLVTLVDDARETGGSTRERLGLLFQGLVQRSAEIAPIHREFVGSFFHAAHGTRDAAASEIRVSDAILRLLEAGEPSELPGGASPVTFAELVLGAIYSTTLEWVHREDYDIERHTREVGEFLVALLPAGSPHATHEQST